MLKDLIVFSKAYDLLKWIHQLTAKHPKSEKFVLAARTENGALDLLVAVAVNGAELISGWNMRRTARPMPEP